MRTLEWIGIFVIAAYVIAVAVDHNEINQLRKQDLRLSIELNELRLVKEVKK